jgi:hypothetical protein
VVYLQARDASQDETVHGPGRARPDAGVERRIVLGRA